MTDTSNPLPLTPVEAYERRRAQWLRALVVFFILVLALWIYNRLFVEHPQDFDDDAMHFKYGSIGADVDAGIPVAIWRALPLLCSEHLPDPVAFQALSAVEQRGLGGYRQFGFLTEPGMDRPVGFSQRRLAVERVGLNCAVCHVSTVREANGETSRLVLGMPANTVNLQAYFQFLFDCAMDGDFTTDGVMAAVDAVEEPGWLEGFLLRRAVPQLREALLSRREDLAFLQTVPAFGPGRVDTFNPYKTMVFGQAWDGSVGTADFPSLWNQAPREGMDLHWDGNNNSVFERNISAALGAGATPESLDVPRMLRVAAWIGAPDPREEIDQETRRRRIEKARARPIPGPGELEIPPYPFPVDEDLAARGEPLYQRYCADCHDWQGKAVGTVMAIGALGTDPQRLNSFTQELASLQNTLGQGRWWRFRNFKTTEGYANMPLDGLWARAPYLHNGSVPTLRDLLRPSADRPPVFYRGDDRYDPVDVGFRHRDPVDDRGRALFEYRVSGADGEPIPGNDNGGHVYGSELPPEALDALLEYLKTL